jgi:cytochrome c oxidase cbb3-type subunit I/II
MEVQKFYYDNRVVNAFVIATVIWGVIGFTLGLTVASLLVWPEIPEMIFGTDEFSGLFGNTPQALAESQGYLGFGRLRMLHTSGVIFAFVGNSIFAGIYYSLQRLLKTRMYSDVLSWINFWGWQLILVLVVITFLMGFNTSKEYAEHEWPIDILTALIWVTFGINMFGTILKRRVRHLYVAIWFYIATWIGITMLHIFNNMAIPLSWDIFHPKSYSAYAGVQDALVQWWYGHNAVAFFLTTPVLGLMYYFMPKAANRPVFSYKLSIIHFWSLIFVYIWAGPHHLLYTALPSWAQALGTAFSIMLIAPSWGGMLNGLLTLRGAWDKVREEPILKFFVVAVTCYGMGTFEGPLLATKTLNKVGHFTDWVIAHVHVGALGWNGFIAFGVAYYIIPRIFKTNLYSTKLANMHFWLGTLGIIFYVVPMYISGMSQGLMLKQFNPDGTLAMKNWLEMITAITPYLFMRVIGGLLYVSGSLLMLYNIFATIKQGTLVANEPAEAPALQVITQNRKQGEGFHLWLERMPLYLSVLSFLTLAIGGMVEILPTFLVKSNIPTISAVKPYTPLELEGRDLYIREGCNACHSQMIRPFRDEVARFTGGWTAKEYSKAGEFVYDRPFLWGSKRTGPDLARQGKKNPSSWHFKHMLNPRSTSPGSIMPRYPWLIANPLDDSKSVEKIKLMKNSFDVPYSDSEVTNVKQSMEAQQKQIVSEIYSEASDIKEQYEKLKKEQGDKFVPLEKREITALISYLQRLGQDIKSVQTETASK